MRIARGPQGAIPAHRPTKDGPGRCAVDLWIEDSSPLKESSLGRFAGFETELPDAAGSLLKNRAIEAVPSKDNVIIMLYGHKVLIRSSALRLEPFGCRVPRRRKVIQDETISIGGDSRTIAMPGGPSQPAHDPCPCGTGGSPGKSGERGIGLGFLPHDNVRQRFHAFSCRPRSTCEVAIKQTVRAFADANRLSAFVIERMFPFDGDRSSPDNFVSATRARGYC